MYQYEHGQGYSIGLSIRVHDSTALLNKQVLVYPISATVYSYGNGVLPTEYTGTFPYKYLYRTGTSGSGSADGMPYEY